MISIINLARASKTFLDTYVIKIFNNILKVHEKTVKQKIVMSERYLTNFI